MNMEVELLPNKCLLKVVTSLCEVKKAWRPLAPANSLALAWKQRTGKMVGSDGDTVTTRHVHYCALIHMNHVFLIKGEPHVAERVYRLHFCCRRREFEENESPQSESVISKRKMGTYMILKIVDSENNKDSKSEDNPTFQEQATVKKKSKSLNKKVDKQRSSNDWSMGSLSDRFMADIVNSPENQ
nr:hypothetical protein [Tanacetum cinerariifolium]